MQLSPYSDRDSPNKIWFLCRARGDSPVQQFIGQLDERTLQNTVDLFDATEASGPSRRMHRFRHLKGDVFEFKVHSAAAIRYVAFRSGVGWVVVVAIHKPGGTSLQRLIRRTQRSHDEYERTRS